MKIDAKCPRCGAAVEATTGTVGDQHIQIDTPGRCSAGCEWTPEEAGELGGALQRELLRRFRGGGGRFDVEDAGVEERYGGFIEVVGPDYQTFALVEYDEDDPPGNPHAFRSKAEAIAMARRIADMLEAEGA